MFKKSTRMNIGYENRGLPWGVPENEKNSYNMNKSNKYGDVCWVMPTLIDVKSGLAEGTWTSEGESALDFWRCEA